MNNEALIRERLSGDYGVVSLKILNSIESGEMERIGLKCISDMKGVTQNRFHTHCVLFHSLMVVDACPDDFIIRLSALFHDVGKPSTRTFNPDKNDYQFLKHEDVGAEIAYNSLTKLNIPPEIVQVVTLMVKEHMRLMSDDIGNPALKRFVRDTHPHTDKLLSLMIADRGAHAPPYNDLTKLNEYIAKIREVKIEEKKAVKLVINGHDLIGLGFVPGPIFKEILKDVETWHIENPEISKEECVDRIKLWKN